MERKKNVCPRKRRSRTLDARRRRASTSQRENKTIGTIAQPVRWFRLQRFRMSNYYQKFDSSGGRTQDLEIRSLTPYPLGQGAVRLYLHTSRHVGGKTTVIRAGRPKSRTRFAVYFSRTRGFSLLRPPATPPATLRARPPRDASGTRKAMGRSCTCSVSSRAVRSRVCVFNRGNVPTTLEVPAPSPPSRQKFQRPLLQTPLTSRRAWNTTTRRTR